MYYLLLDISLHGAINVLNKWILNSFYSLDYFQVFQILQSKRFL
jgi:hypothetical protein